MRPDVAAYLYEDVFDGRPVHTIAANLQRGRAFIACNAEVEKWE
jgi:hypothetical protein